VELLAEQVVRRAVKAGAEVTGAEEAHHRQAQLGWPPAELRTSLTMPGNRHLVRGDFAK